MLKPNVAYQLNTVTVKEKIIPDGTVWKDDTKARKSGFRAGQLYKKQCKLTNDTGRVLYITVHNTADLEGTYEDSELYTRATYYENMGAARVHFYVDDVCAWQNLKAGVGISKNDPIGCAEVGWHAGDSDIPDGGNMTSLGIEIIMGSKNKAENDKAYDNGAKLVAALMQKHNIDINHVVSHTYWVNKEAGKHFDDVDTQCTNPIYGQKWCPTYIFNSNKASTAKINWLKFKDVVLNYYNELVHPPKPNPDPDNYQFELLEEVRIKANVTTYANGGKIPSWVKESTLYVRKFLSENRIAISTAKEGDLTGIVYDRDLYPLHPRTNEIKVGDIVKVKDGVTTYSNGKKMPDWVRKSELKVQGFRDSKKESLIVVWEGKDVGDDITGVVFTKDLEKVPVKNCYDKITIPQHNAPNTIKPTECPNTKPVESEKEQPEEKEQPKPQPEAKPKPEIKEDLEPEKEPEKEIEEVKPEPIPDIPETKPEEKKPNIFIRIIQSIINFFRTLFSRKK